MKNEKFYQKQKGEILTVVAVTACMALGVLAAVKFNWDLTTKPISTLSGDNQIVLEKEEIRLPKAHKTIILPGFNISLTIAPF